MLNALGASSVLRIGTAGMALVLATVPLANPAGVLVGSVLTLTVPRIDAAADASGTAMEAVINNGLLDVVSGLTVNTAGADVIVPNTGFIVGQTVTLISASITHG